MKKSNLISGLIGAGLVGLLWAYTYFNNSQINELESNNQIEVYFYKDVRSGNYHNIQIRRDISREYQTELITDERGNIISESAYLRNTNEKCPVFSINKTNGYYDLCRGSALSTELNPVESFYADPPEGCEAVKQDREVLKSNFNKIKRIINN